MIFQAPMMSSSSKVSSLSSLPQVGTVQRPAQPRPADRLLPCPCRPLLRGGRPVGQEVHEVQSRLFWGQRDSLFWRYALLGYVLCLRRISEAVQEQFPDAEALVQAGGVISLFCYCVDRLFGICDVCGNANCQTCDIYCTAQVLLVRPCHKEGDAVARRRSWPRQGVARAHLVVHDHDQKVGLQWRLFTTITPSFDIWSFVQGKGSKRRGCWEKGTDRDTCQVPDGSREDRFLSPRCPSTVV